MEHITVNVPCERYESLGERQASTTQKQARCLVVVAAIALLGVGAVTRPREPTGVTTNAYVTTTTSVPSAVHAVPQRWTAAPMSVPAFTGVAQGPHGQQWSRPAYVNEPAYETRVPAADVTSTWPLMAFAASAVAALAAFALRPKQQPAMALFSVTGQPTPAQPSDEEGVEPALNPDDMIDVTEPESATATETITGEAESFGFETNTRQILDIVARSLYTDKEVFVRELVSNASDALEKARYLGVSRSDLQTGGEPKISLYCDAENNTFTIQDTGVGMNKEELLANLGTIASSGSKKFIESLKEGGKDMSEDIIGQFGVGFYSAFIVATKVRVFTKSILPGSQGYCWESDGSGNFTITEADGVTPGTKIIVELMDTEKDFATKSHVEGILKKYSNFISFPIMLNGDRVNTVEALWRKEPRSVSDAEHEEFYKYIASAFDKPQYRLHYRVDAPVDVKAVFYVGEYNMEQPGRTRLQPNVSLYCKKVLIKKNCAELLPDWMRFIAGVVDSEDLPLNISREGTQDSQAFRKLSRLVTKRVIKWLGDQSTKDAEKYNAFFKEFGYFIKEGACMDKKNQVAMLKLLRFESSEKEAGELTSFDDYIDRMPDGQSKIYFLHSPTRETALMSPYYEQFKKKGIEVLFMYGQLDEYMMSEYQDYKEVKFCSVEETDVNIDDIKSTKEDEADDDSDTETVGDKLTPGQCRRFKEFLIMALGSDKVMDAKASNRLTDTPAIIAAGFEQAAVYRHIKNVANLQGKKGFEGGLGQQVVEFNPGHPIIQRLYWLSRSKEAADETKAKLMAEQIFDNALIAAGLLDDPRLMLGRLNSLLSDALSDVEIGLEEEEPEPEPEPEVVAEPVAADPNAVPGQSEMDRKLDELLQKEIASGNVDPEKLRAMFEQSMKEQAEEAEEEKIQEASFSETGAVDDGTTEAKATATSAETKPTEPSK